MSLRIFPIVAAFILAGCSSGQNKVTLLSAAGFRTLVPSTPAQRAQLQSMPPGRIIPVQKKGKTFFLYADRQNHALLIGNQRDYTTYQQYARQYHLEQDKVEAAQWNDACWDGWGDGFWGPGFY